MRFLGLFRKKKPLSEEKKIIKLGENEVLTCISILKDRSIVAQQLELSPREEAAMKLGEAQDERAIQPLLDVLTSESEGDTLRYLALEALGKIGGEEVKEGIINAFKNGDNFLREMVDSHLNPEKGVLRKTGLTRTVLYGKTAEEMSVIDRAEQCYKEGCAYCDKRDWKKALAKFKEASNLNPNHLFVHQQLARVYIELRDIQEAERELHKQIEVNYDDFYSHAVLSIIYEARGMLLEAREEEIRAMQTSAYRQYYSRISRDYADKVASLVRKHK
ncbi:MAG TPA: tetratricopeptide repeat protein [Candidatus Bathyarchaeia archaeon]|nr:tetratricopeptide repeat protein [Candidatus Bathyarchaeia archaeon]